MMLVINHVFLARKIIKHVRLSEIKDQNSRGDNDPITFSAGTLNNMRADSESPRF